MKRIAVVTAETGKITDLSIEPGTEAQEVLQQLGLPEGYVLSSGRCHEPFGGDEIVYDKVSDGCKLFASTPVEVGV